MIFLVKNIENKKVFNENGIIIIINQNYWSNV